MKRNNLLMLSFIILMAICAFVKGIWDYTMWTTIVSAITVASWLFAIADLCFSQSVAQIRIAEEQLGDTEAALSEVEMISKAVDVRLKQLEGKPIENEVPQLHSHQDEVRYFTSVKTDIQEIESDLTGYKDRLIKGKKSAKTNKILGCAITVFGFLVFFLIVVFKPLMEAPVEGMDELTVWAFTIILATQYLETWLEEQREKKKIESQKNVSALDALRKSFESEVRHNAD